MLDKVRSAGIALIYRILKGDKTVTNEQRLTSQFVAGHFVAPHTSPQVHVTVSWKEIEDAARRAGLTAQLPAQFSAIAQAHDHPENAGDRLLEGEVTEAVQTPAPQAPPPKEKE